MGIKKTLASLVLAGATILALGNGGCSVEDKKYISDEFTKSVIMTRDVAVDMYTGPSRVIIDGTQKILSYEPTKKR
jgi:hypothetical protein